MTPAIVVTGGFGFIGSNLILRLNQRGIIPYVIDSWKENDPKWRNVHGLRFERITEEDFCEPWLEKPIIVALGASVDTKEGMSEALWQNNVDTLIRLQKLASHFIYASSGATYGAEEVDFTERVNGIVPMCPYAATKLYVDNAFFSETTTWPRHTYGLRFFNVYGPREVHKGDMASLVTKGLLKQPPLYQPKRVQGAHHEAITDGRGNLSSIRRVDTDAQETHWSLFSYPTGQTIERDFVFVDDVTSVILHFLDYDDIPSGLYNLGTGTTRSFEDLVKAVEPLPIEYVPLPDSLRNQYQRRTCANITKLREVAGYKLPFTSLEEGVELTRVWMKEEGLL